MSITNNLLRMLRIGFDMINKIDLNCTDFAKFDRFTKLIDKDESA